VWEAGREGDSVKRQAKRKGEKVSEGKAFKNANKKKHCNGEKGGGGNMGNDVARNRWGKTRRERVGGEKKDGKGFPMHLNASGPLSKGRITGGFPKGGPAGTYQASICV